MYSGLGSKVLWYREVLISVCVKSDQAEESQGALWETFLEFDPIRGRRVSKTLLAKISTRLPVIVPPRSEGLSTRQTKKVDGISSSRLKFNKTPKSANVENKSTSCSRKVLLLVCMTFMSHMTDCSSSDSGPVAVWDGGSHCSIWKQH